ncbi:hypothetical protein, conserved, partial [Eimeria maxima]
MVCDRCWLFVECVLPNYALCGVLYHDAECRCWLLVEYLLTHFVEFRISMGNEQMFVGLWTWAIVVGAIKGCNKEGNSVFSDEERMQGRCYTALVSVVDEPIRLDGWEVRFVKVSFGVLSASAIRVEDICEG